MEMLRLCRRRLSHRRAYADGPNLLGPFTPVRQPAHSEDHQGRLRRGGMWDERRSNNARKEATGLVKGAVAESGSPTPRRSGDIRLPG